MKVLKHLTIVLTIFVLCIIVMPKDIFLADENFVIMLDPGHDDTHAGAQNGSMGEEDVVLKITQYCKEELEKYSNVTVYMTREGSACANGGSAITSADCNAARVQYASNVGADIYVSFHLNSSTSSAANGVGVYHPNANYRPDLGHIGNGVATAIFGKLRDLGIAQWSDGVLIRNSEDNTLYPDGSLADYLGVIRRSKEAGIPAVLIEHAFLSNASDRANFLSTDQQLKLLGVADANAIIEYYGLTEVESEVLVSDVQIQNKNTVIGSFDVVVSNLNVPGGINKILVPTWSKSDQSDIVWYEAVSQGDGTYRAHIDVANHNCNFTKYNVHTYVSTNRNIMQQLDETVVDMNAPTTKVSAVVDGNITNIQLEAWHVPGTFGNSLQSVSFAVWSDENGQDDLIWYNASLSADKYVATAPFVNHRATGKYYVHAYARYINGTQKLVGTKTIEISGETSGTTEIVNLNSVSGNFDVVVKDVVAMGGVQQVQVPIWSKADQSDIIWYNAQLQVDGTYRVHVDVASHGNNFAKYYVHTYVTNGYGVKHNVDSDVANLTPPNVKISANMNESCSDITLEAWHVPGTFGQSLTGVRFAVWSANGGQDDLKWYNATAISDKFVVDLPMANHTDTGTHYIHIYADRPNGVSEFVGGITYDRPLTAIMGTSQVSAAQLVTYYTKHATYPAYYQNTDAPTIESFCQIYVEECVAEGVKVEVAFAQAMLETGFLTYGGDVSITQNNFAGIGATGNGEPGNSFSSVREGIRAHVQHLKAYASTDSLNQGCVDPRFSYITRGTAPYVEWLGIQENPYAVGWAASNDYGYIIRDQYIHKLYE